MKHILITVFSILSLAGRAQDSNPDSALFRCCHIWPHGDTVAIKSDTIRAMLLVTYNGSNMSIAHTKPGYVVRVGSVDKLFLDDKKAVIKSPIEVWTYKLK